MTVVDTDRIDMADISDELTLDEMFEWLEPTPEGFKVEIVEGTVHMSPQRDTHWRIILAIIKQLLPRFAEDRLLSDVRIDFGEGNGFAPDIVKLFDKAAKDNRGRWLPEHIEFVGEVISKGTAAADYGPKKAAYAAAGVPVFLIVDPYVGRCLLHSEPKDGDYHKKLVVDFGLDVDLTGTSMDLVLKTDAFPRD
ncbi:Uma2 family endonuclease [Streptomyces sp. ME02-6991-2A]|uniref:Uma2 family endonuclease n=1 Tax=Streptomyces sp. ME02-6991-2A TaxID=3028677 RepID=UPI0010082898|nr:Uma2 family endonuclease [Streptomyces sp. ME02-6991-2A]MDX3379499.1 Uma2 family endonuclease [Streptomyces sp. ME02-6991-2A]